MPPSEVIIRRASSTDSTRRRSVQRHRQLNAVPTTLLLNDGRPLHVAVYTLHRRTSHMRIANCRMLNARSPVVFMDMMSLYCRRNYEVSAPRTQQTRQWGAVKGPCPCTTTIPCCSISAPSSHAWSRDSTQERAAGVLRTVSFGLGARRCSHLIISVCCK